MTRINDLKLWVAVFFVLLLVFSFFPSNVLAQVVINEISSSTSNNDWIELYNTSTSEVDLKGWYISDTAATPVYEFEESAWIPEQGFCVKDVSGRLNNLGDRIKLFQGSTEKDCVAYGNGNGEFCGLVADIDVPVEGLVVARKPDGTGGWTLTSPTNGYSNEASSEPNSKLLCYVPSPIPTIIQPTSTPTPLLSPTPTFPPPTPTPTSKPTATPTKVPTLSATPTEEMEGEILGEIGSLTTSPTPTSSESKTEAKSKSALILSVLAAVIGGSFIGFAFLLWRKRQGISDSIES